MGKSRRKPGIGHARNDISAIRRGNHRIEVQSAAIIHNGAQERLRGFGEQFAPLGYATSGELYYESANRGYGIWLPKAGTYNPHPRCALDRPRAEEAREIFLPDNCARTAKFGEPGAGLTEGRNPFSLSAEEELKLPSDLQEHPWENPADPKPLSK